MSYSCTCNCHLPFGLCKCYYGRTPREAYCKAAVGSESGCKSCVKKSKHTSSKDSLQTLHWLPIRSQINFKIVVLVYKCLHGEAPEYLQNLLTTHVPGREGLRSETIIDRLIVQKTEKKTFADLTFMVAGPKLWKSLLNDVKWQKYIEHFKKSLKTHLFKLAFNV